MLGVSGVTKTTWGGIEWDEATGRCSNATGKTVTLRNGTKVEQIMMDVAYPHVGRRVRLDGSDADALAQRLATDGYALVADWLSADDAAHVRLEANALAFEPSRVISGGRKVVAVCTAGPKSAIAVEFLLEFGIDAYAVDGGLLGWHAAGLPVAGLLDDDDDDDDDFEWGFDDEEPSETVELTVRKS
mgnify:CR=1 FL=1